MNRLVLIPIAVAVICLPLLAMGPSTAEKQVASMKWLAGNWKGNMWGGEFRAHYSTPDGGMVLSYSELESDGAIGHWEFEKFAVADDKVVLQPYPGGRPATSLTLTKIEAKKAVFENPKKDYPTRITYEVVKGHLKITLDDPHGESKKTEVFDLKRS